MSAFNAFFAQLTGGGTPSPSNRGGAAAEQQGHDAGTSGGGGSGGGDASGSSSNVRRGSGSGTASDRERGSSSSDAFGIPVNGTSFTYRITESDRGRFGTPQCELTATLPEASIRRGLCGQGALIAANAEFMCYSIKHSIRVIHRSTGARALIKMSGLQAGGTPQDMSLMSTFEYPRDASNLLACSTSEGDVVVWELKVRIPGSAPSPAAGGTAAALAAAGAAAVEVTTTGFLCITGAKAQSVEWQPAGGYRHLAVICGSTVVICDLESLHAPPSVGNKGGLRTISLKENGQRIPGPACLGHSQQVTNISFSADGAILATTGNDCIVRLWDARVALLQLKPAPEVLSCLCAFRVAKEGSRLNRVLVVDVDAGGGVFGNSRATVITGDEDNRFLKVWVAPTRFATSPSSSTPSAVSTVPGADGLEGLLPLQELHLPGVGPLSLEMDPKSNFIFAADAGEGLLYALHLGGGSYGIRMDYLRPYALAHPVQSFAVLEQEPEAEYGYDEQESPSGDGRVLQLICVQTKPVQIYRISVRDALPPPGVRGQDAEKAERAPKPAVTTQKAVVNAAAAAALAGKSADLMGSRNTAATPTAAAAGGKGGAGGVPASAQATPRGGGGGSGVKFEKKLDVADEPLAPTTIKTTPTGSIASRSGVGSSQQQQVAVSAAPSPLTPAGDFTAAAGSRTNSGAGVMLGDGAGGGAGVPAARLGATPARTEKPLSGEDSIAGGAGTSTAGSAEGSPSAQESSSQSTPEGWVGAAQDEWDQESDHAVAVASAAAAAVRPMTAGGDSLSETSSSGGGGDAPLPPPSSRHAIPSLSPRATSTATGTTTAGTSALLGMSPRPVPAAAREGAGCAGGKGVSPMLSSGARRAADVATAPPAAEEGQKGSSSPMPSAAPQERPVSPEFRHFLTPHELESFGAPASSTAGGSSQSSRAPPFGAHDASSLGAAGEEGGEAAAAGGRESRDDNAEEQSVSVSVSEERQEVGSTTREDATAAALMAAATATADGTSSGAGVGQATGTNVIFASSRGGESTDASYQVGRDVMGIGSGGGSGSGTGSGGGGGAGAGEPSASGSGSIGGSGGSSAHGDASGGSSSTLTMHQHQQHQQQQRGREADNSAGGAPLTASLSGALHPPPPPPVAALSPTAGGEASRDIGAMRTGRSIPGVTVDQSATLALRSLLMGGNGGGGVGGGGGSSLYAGGGLATASAGKGGISTLASSSLTGLPRPDAEGAGAGNARPPLSPSHAPHLAGSFPAPSSRPVATSTPISAFGSSSAAPASAQTDSITTATAEDSVSSGSSVRPAPVAIRSPTPTAPLPSPSIGSPLTSSPSTAEAVAAGSRTANAFSKASFLRSSTQPPNPVENRSSVVASASHSPAVVPAAVGGGAPVSTGVTHARSMASATAATTTAPSLIDTTTAMSGTATPSSASASAARGGAGDGGMAGFAAMPGVATAPVTNSGSAVAAQQLSPSSKSASTAEAAAGGRGGSMIGGPGDRSMLGNLSAANTDTAETAAISSATGGSATLPQQAPPSLVYRTPAEVEGNVGAGAGGGVDQEALAEAVGARVAEEVAGSMAEMQEYMLQMVTARCREGVAEAMAAAQETKNSERAELVEDISASLDHTLRRGMAETVANPLAKLVVSTARQVVADPLQTAMATLHGQQQRSAQALAAAAHAGATAAVQAASQTQVSAMATAASRAQAGAVRREVLECKEDLSHAVSSSVQEPVSAAFRECFEGQLIPTLQTAVNRMFEQINTTLTRGLQASPLVSNKAGALSDDMKNVRSRVDGVEAGLRDVTKTLAGLGEKMDRLAELTLAIQKTATSTASAVEAQGEAQAEATKAAARAVGAQAVRAWAVSAPADEPVPPPVTVDPREELLQLLLAGRLEEAMNKALSASSLPLVMWLCGRLDSSSTPPTLPQHILLCLLQQLGTSDLLEETTVKLQWLQNCALAIDPTESKIRVHLPLVLSQLRNALTQAMPTISNRGGPDLGVIRMTMHVVNSLALTAGATQPSSSAAAAGSAGVQ